MKNFKKIFIIFLIIFSLLAGFSLNWIIGIAPKTTADNLSLDEQEATIRAIKKVMPAVVNIIVYNKERITMFDLNSGREISKEETVEKGAGTGFLVSSNGLIITNKHVVNAASQQKTSSYQVVLSNDKKYYAQLIGKDPINDLAILKIFDKNLPYVELGDSDSLEIGTTVIAIGNVLGKYHNSVTKGIVSGLGRSIAASDQLGNAEALDNVIQTDAEINFGNSGGPLVDLNGRVVGINVAVDQAGSSIGFAIPINDARPVIKTVKEIGRIKRPRLGVRYLMITPELAIKKNLPRSSGALIIKGEGGEPAILPGTAAAKAGLEEGDIIFEINAIKIKGKNTLLAVIQKYQPGDKIGLKIQRGKKVIIKIVTLDEFK